MGFKLIVNADEAKIFFNDIDISKYVMTNFEIINRGLVASGTDRKMTQLLSLRIEVDLEELNGMKLASATLGD